MADNSTQDTGVTRNPTKKRTDAEEPDAPKVNWAEVCGRLLVAHTEMQLRNVTFYGLGNKCVTETLGPALAKAKELIGE